MEEEEWKRLEEERQKQEEEDKGWKMWKRSTKKNCGRRSWRKQDRGNRRLWRSKGEMERELEGSNKK